MEKVIPTFYSEYGRYISRWRMIPLDIDCLLPVERRVLLVLNQFGSSKSIKSFRIDGTVIGSYHPHGSCYGTLVQLVRNGFASDSDSSWGGTGGLNPSPPPHSRYTETRILPWVHEFAFEFIKDIPWENLELDYEPLYLPSVLPLGLIGKGLINGLSFHKTLIPKYSKEDLAKRLIWLLENGKPKPPKDWSKPMDESKFGPKILPNKPDCDLDEDEPNAFYKLLILGEGKVKYKPKVTQEEIEVIRNKKKSKIKVISINGKSPNATFDSLLKDYDSNKLPLTNAPTDQSKKQDTCIYLEPKRGTDFDEFQELVQTKYLNKVIHFKCYTCNLDGVVNQTAIDDLLLNCIAHWKEAFRKHISNDIDRLSQKIVENYICEFLHNCIINKVKDLNDIIQKFKNLTKTIQIYYVENDSTQIKNKTITIQEKDVTDIYNKTPIKKLVEFKQNKKLIDDKIQDYQKQLNNLDQTQLDRLKEITQ